MIGKYIQKLRQEKGMSLSELADRAGIAKSYLSSIEREIQGNPSIKVLEKLAVVLEIRIEDLLHPNANREDNSHAEIDKSLDQDWLELVRDAMSSGVSKEQFREFLEFNKWRLHSKEES